MFIFKSLWGIMNKTGKFLKVTITLYIITVMETF